MSGDESVLDDETGALLSAYLDGEVSAAEATEVRSLLERSSAARAELEALQAVRSTVRGLPEVEPPPGFYEDLDLVPTASSALGADAPADAETAAGAGAAGSEGYRPRSAGAAQPSTDRRHRTRRRVARAVAAVGVAAIAVVLLAGITPITDRFVPPVDAFAARHDAMESGATAVPNPPAMAFTDAPASELDAEGIPETMAGDMARVHGYVGNDGMVHAVFTDGKVMVSVYAQDGAVDWPAMPGGDATMEVAGAPAAQMHTGRDAVVVVDRGGRIFTVVSGGDQARMMAVVSALPDSGRSMMGRANDACRSVVASFGAHG